MKISIIGSEKFRQQKDKAIQAFLNQSWTVYDICRLVNQGQINAQKFIKESDYLYLVVVDGYASYDSAYNLGYARACDVPTIASEIITNNQHFNNFIDNYYSLEEWIPKLTLIDEMLILVRDVKKNLPTKEQFRILGSRLLNA